MSPQLKTLRLAVRKRSIIYLVISCDQTLYIKLTMLMEELSLEYIIYDPSYNYDDGDDSDMDCDDGKDINYN